MVSVEGASAVEPAKIHNIPNLNNFSGITDDEDKSTGTDPLIARPIVVVAPKQYLPLESVCQTAGFINSQNQQVVKFPTNVRFIVHPVAEDEIRKADLEPHEEDGSCHLSAQSFTFSGGNSSADDINGHYSM
jgi:hypothetical protein